MVIKRFLVIMIGLLVIMMGLLVIIMRIMVIMMGFLVMMMIPADGFCSWFPSWVSSREVKPEMFLVKINVFFSYFIFLSF